MKALLAAVASACLMSVAFQASAMDDMKKDGMTKEQTMKHDEMMKKCADKAGMSKDDMSKCDAVMKKDSMKHDDMMKKDDMKK